MGLVMEWSNMLERFFSDVFFEAIWELLGEEFLTEAEDGSEAEKKAATFESMAEQSRMLEKLTEQSEMLERVAKRSLMPERIWEGEALKLKGKSERGLDYYASEREKEPMLPIDGFAMDYAKEEEGFFRGGKDLISYEHESVFEEEAGGRRVLERDLREDGMGPVDKEKTKKLISLDFSHGAETKNEIKIEMVSKKDTQSGFDMENAVDMLTERLCELMTRGADGLYL